MRKWILAFVFAMSALTAISSFASSITQTNDFNSISGVNGYLIFNQFNDNGGAFTLQSIEISMTLNINGGKLMIDNDYAQPVSVVFEFGMKAEVSSGDVSLPDSFLPGDLDPVAAYQIWSFTLQGNIDDGPGDYDTQGPDGRLCEGGFASDNKSGYVGNASWNSGTKGFLGSGTYNIDYSVFPWSVPTFDPDVEEEVNYMSIQPGAFGEITVVYNYDIVPEPATIALLCVGGAFVILGSKTRKQEVRK